MTHAELLGYAAAACVFVTFYMKTMVPLRIAGIVSNFLFIGYGYALDAYPVLILHLVLLPLNIVRLQQMLRLIKQIEDVTRGDVNLKWVKPFSTTKAVAVGDAVFRRGDPADEMFFIVSGRFRVQERNVDLQTGEIFGELGLLDAGQARTATVECMASGELLRITYDQVKQLCLQDPKFGFYFLHLVSKRLFHNLSLESRQPG
ncbi:MAG: cyclic nucleotide-binding domain-containing protein [Bradyrhizobium sp.]|jgi:CRP/FNR family cyclic AMP-dependent transcriptional regulator|uniref:Crp/Fnr family transcriptional regulator n=1 Tax=Bradyrhizobium sp. TaxID=376 RepID=UPI003C51C10A